MFAITAPTSISAHPYAAYFKQWIGFGVGRVHKTGEVEIVGNRERVGAVRKWHRIVTALVVLRPFNQLVIGVADQELEKIDQVGLRCVNVRVAKRLDIQRLHIEPCANTLVIFDNETVLYHPVAVFLIIDVSDTEQARAKTFVRQYLQNSISHVFAEDKLFVLVASVLTMGNQFQLILALKNAAFNLTLPEVQSDWWKIAGLLLVPESTTRAEFEVKRAGLVQFIRITKSAVKVIDVRPDTRQCG
jgi:hypothetical protein